MYESLGLGIKLWPRARRHRLRPEEVAEVKMGLLLRMQELLKERTDIEAASIAYKTFSKLMSQEKGRLRSVNVSWDLIEYTVFSLL